MPGRTAKPVEKPPASRTLSPEIPTPVKQIASQPIDETTAMEENTVKPLSEKNDIKPMDILLANGQPLLTNFEEKYLIELITKSSNDDIENLIQEKLSSILQMNYGSSSSLYRYNHSWLFDFCLKHFQTLVNHHNASIFFGKLLKKGVDRTNSTLTFKYWQLETLINEHLKQNPSGMPQKRRMTVRRIDFH